jgi:carboxyl-terminal processing protease
VENFVDVFNAMHDIVSKNYCHFEARNINPPDLYNKYTPLINGCNNSVDFRKNMLRYFAELKNDHSMILYDKYGVFCTARMIENRVFVDEVYRAEPRASFHEKDEIIAIDDAPVAEWIDKNKEYVSASTGASLTARTVASVFCGYFPDKRKYVTKSNDRFSETVVDLEKIDEWELHRMYIKENVRSKVIEKDIGYIILNSMMGNTEEFEKEYFKVRHLPYLIVDIRRNHGGNSGLSEEISVRLIKNPQKACVSGQTLEPNQNSYRGQLVLLTDVTTASAAESFVLDIKESKSGIVMGAPTSGDTGHGPRSYTLDDGAEFIIPTAKFPQESPGGFPMEGVGIPPDYHIAMTVKDYLNNTDSVLEYAIEKIKSEEI